MLLSTRVISLSHGTIIAMTTIDLSSTGFVHPPSIHYIRIIIHPYRYP